MTDRLDHSERGRMIRSRPGHLPVVAPDLSDGAVLLDGRYLVAPDAVAAPGGGLVARDTLFSRDVVLRLWPDDDEGRTRWLQDVSALTSGRRDVPHLLDAGTDAGHCWIALPCARPALPDGVRVPPSLAADRTRPRRRRPGTAPAAGLTDVTRLVATGALASALLGGVLVGLRAEADPGREPARAPASPAVTAGGGQATGGAGGLRPARTVEVQSVAVQPVVATVASSSPPSRARTPASARKPRARHVESRPQPGRRPEHAGPHGRALGRDDAGPRAKPGPKAAKPPRAGHRGNA